MSPTDANTSKRGRRKHPNVCPRRIVKDAAVAILFVASLGCLSSAGSQTIQPVDRVVAVINDDVIVETELQTQMRQVESQLRQSGRPAPPPGVLQQQVLERLVLERLQLQVAERLGIRVDDEDLNRAVANIAERNNLSIEEFSEILARDGYPFAAFRENIRNEMLISRVRQRQIASRIQVRDRETEIPIGIAEVNGTYSDHGYSLVSIGAWNSSVRNRLRGRRIRIDALFLQQFQPGERKGRWRKLVRYFPTLRGGCIGRRHVPVSRKHF